MANRSKLDVLDQKYKHVSGSRRSVFVYIFRLLKKQYYPWGIYRVYIYLFERFATLFGIAGGSLEWLKSYLTKRSQLLRVPGAESSPVILEYGVHHGSVLGPLIFIPYSSPLSEIISRFGIKSLFFSNDCIAEMKQWTDQNKLKFHVGKTDIILVYSGSSRNQPKDIRIEVGEESIKPSSSVRNLGFTLDSNLTLENHIKIICGISICKWTV